MIDPQSLIGREIDGRYRLETFLGDGAFGWAYGADEVLFGDVIGSCALKIIRPKGDAERAGIMREIKAMAQLSHPRLIGFKAAGEIRSGDFTGSVYIAMELGQHSLAHRLQRPERMSVDEVRNAALHVCEALAYLHAQDAVHRDVKPGNVFRVNDGWKLGDFGLVRGLEGSVVAGTGRRGTPLYTAPEVLEDLTGPASDVWALGVMMQECLSGEFPYFGETEFALMKRLMTAEPTIPEDLPAPFDAFVLRCLVRDRKARWGAAEALEFLRSGGDVRGSIGQTAQPQSAPPIIPPSGAPATPLRPSPAARSAHARPVMATPSPNVAPSSRAVPVAAAPSISAPASSLPPGLRPLGTNAQGYGEAENVKEGTVLIRVPAGTFMMGSNANDREKPPHRLDLPAFWIAKTTVTNAQYRKFVAETRHKSAGDWEARALEWGEQVPVVNVSWNDAVAYAAWAGLRLPTEAEWEYAARGPEGREFPWGSAWDAARCCNSVGRSAGKPVPVGSYPQGASCFGCLDLAGNVWEWCSSKYAQYPYTSTDGREGLSGLGPRVARGGSWNYFFDPTWFRGARRVRGSPTVGSGSWGFRCARTL